MTEYLRDLFLDPGSPVGLSGDVLVNVVTEGIGIALTVIIVAPLTARWVRWQENRRWKEVRFQFVQSVVDKLNNIDLAVRVLTQKLASHSRSRDAEEARQSILRLAEILKKSADGISELFRGEGFILSPEMVQAFAAARDDLGDIQYGAAMVHDTLTRLYDELRTDKEQFRVRTVLFVEQVPASGEEAAEPGWVARLLHYGRRITRCVPDFPAEQMELTEVTDEAALNDRLQSAWLSFLSVFGQTEQTRDPQYLLLKPAPEARSAP